MNTKQLIILIAVLFFAIGGGVAAYLLTKNTAPHTSPVAQTNDKPNTNEEIEQVEKVSYSGEFKDADATHKGSGTLHVAEINNVPTLSFEQNFVVGEGPDLYVYLSKNETSQGLGEYVSLGKLTSLNGQQSYKLPDDYQDYKSVVIWCQKFSVPFATADLVKDK